MLGDGPRLEAIANEDVGTAAWELVHALREKAGAARATEIPEFLRLMVKHGEIFRCQMEMGAVLFQGSIPARERELAVLRISWLAGAPYEWGEHVEIGKRCGLSAEEIERVTHGSKGAGWSAHDAAVLRGVEELMADQAVSDATWQELAQTWDEMQLIEYPMMVGQYLTTAFIFNSLRVRLAEGNNGLDHR